MSIHQLISKGYQLQISATCDALYQISVGGVHGNETAGEMMKSIMEGLMEVLVFYNGTDDLYTSLNTLWKDQVSPTEIIPFQMLINATITGKKELEDREKIKILQYMPAVLNVVALKIKNFQEWKEEDDDLKKAMRLFKVRYDFCMEFIKKHKKSQTDEGKDSAQALKETFTKPLIAKNKKDTKSRTRRYQCPYGCMTVFLKKNDLFRHQKETNRACKYKNAEQLPVNHLPQSEHTLLDMIGGAISKISDDHFIEILPEDAMAISIAILKGIKTDAESNCVRE